MNINTQKNHKSLIQLYIIFIRKLNLPQISHLFVSFNNNIIIKNRLNYPKIFKILKPKIKFSGKIRLYSEKEKLI